jgi:hypothetical protein
MAEAEILSQKLQLQLSHELSSSNEGTVQEQFEMHKKPCTILRSTKEGYEPRERKKVIRCSFILKPTFPSVSNLSK